MAWVKWITLGFVALYLVALIYVYVAQRKFMYFPPPEPIPQDVFAGRILPITVEGIGDINSIYNPRQHMMRLWFYSFTVMAVPPTNTKIITRRLALGAQAIWAWNIRGMRPMWEPPMKAIF